MSYQQQGFPQQAQNFQQGDQGPAPERTSPATALLAAVLALGAAVGVAMVGFDFLSEIPEGASFGDLPGKLQAIPILDLGAAVVLLIGAILVVARKLFGAVIVVLGALAAIAAVLLVPVLIERNFGPYIEAVFKFDSRVATMSALALILAPLALILAILPSTLRHLRDSADAGYTQTPPTW